MRRNAMFRQSVVTLGIFLLSFIIFGMSTLILGRSFLIREKRDNLYANAEEIRSFISTANYDRDLSSLTLRMELIFLSRCTNTQVLLCSTDGVIVTSSDFDMPGYTGRQLDDETLAALQDNDLYEGIDTLGGLFDESRYIVAEPLLAENGFLRGYLIVTAEAGGMLSTWSSFVLIFVLVSLTLVVVALTLEYANARHVARPLREMADAADRFAHGDYSVRVGGYDRPDEIGTLMTAFNRMAQALQDNESRRSAFVANVSHELRTPMTTISGFADGILDGTIPPEEEKKYLTVISSETKRLSRLVRSMLDMSRLKDGDPTRRERVFDLCEAVVQTVLNFEKRVDEKHLNIVLNMPEDPVRVKGDVDSLTRVIYNLTDNAIKFADPGSDLVLNVWRQDGKAFTSVQDTGPTIPPEELKLIFDRFHKADRSRGLNPEGVGLGLYMVREIIAAHDQDIFVTSEDGLTTFTFTLAEADVR